MDAAILLTQIDITCSFNYLGNILRHGRINPNLDFFLFVSSDSYRLPLIKSCCNLSEINVTCLSHVSFLETGQNSLFVYLYVCPQPVYRSSVLFCFHTALVPFFFDVNSLCLHRVSILYGASFYLLMCLTAAGKVSHRLICCKKLLIFYSSNSEGWDQFPATTGSWK